MLKNLKRAAAIVLSFAMAIQFGLANSYYVNAEEEPVEPQQEQTTTVENNSEVQEEVANEDAVPETKSVELSYVAEDGTILQAATYRDFDLNYGLNTDSSVMLDFDGYTLKDVIVNNSQTVSADQASLSVTSDLASVQFVYKKVITETENQTTEPAKTEEKNEDDAEADPDSETEVKEELVEYPAFDQSEMAGDVVVHATAAEGVLPRDSKLVVKRITRKAILNAVEETVSEKNMEVESAVALDVTIQSKDGVEIQPNGFVNISFENVATTAQETNVYHVTNDASTVTEVATNAQSFDADHFSIYVITNENKVPLTTFNFVANGTTVSTQIVKSGDTLIAPTAPDMIGQAFVGWVDEAGNSFTGFGKQAEITETTTRTITARYEAALYVYFLNPDGTQIMRTEKVGDHDAHNFTAVSYEVDSTHKLVGWAAKKNGTINIADKITVPAGQTSVNVYAIIKEGYWVSFNSDGGSIVDSQFVLHGDNLVLDKSTTPTKPGYTFDGWYNGLTKVENGATVTSPMTLTAHWKAAEVSYTINYWQQKVTDDKNASDAQKTYEYVEAVTKKATTGTRISATNSKTYKGFKYNANNSSKDVEISGDGTTIINVYYDRVLCTVNFYVDKGGYLWSDWQITKTVTGLYGANLPEGAWDTSTYFWYGAKVDGAGCVLLTSFDFESAGYANNQGNKTTNGVVTTCNFYGFQDNLQYKINYYNEQADGTFKLVQTIWKESKRLNVYEKYAGYVLYKYSTDKNAGTDASYWANQKDVTEGKSVEGSTINIASKLKTYSLSYYNYNSVTKTEKNIKYTAPLKSYANYTPARPSGLPEYYVFGGWYKDKACTTKFDFNTEKMPNANVQIYAKWTAKKISLTYNLNTPDGTSKKVNRDVDAGTIASTVLPSASAIEGYTFAGWYVADENGHMTTVAFNANDAILRDTSVIGKWLYNGELTVKYVADGVEAPKDNNVYAGGAKATVANGVTKEGKKFLGWQLDGNVYQPGQNFEVNKDLADDKNVITLTAKFGDSETSAILNYHPGNGNGEDQSDAILNNVEVTLKNTSDLRYTAPGNDYYFAGWATSMEDAQKGNAKYAVGDKVRVNADSSNDLYATWVKKTVIEVTANSNTLQYNGEVQKVEGFKEGTGGYVVTGLTAVAEGKDSDTYKTNITGTARVTKDGVDVTDKVIVNTIDGTLTISKRDVTLTSGSASRVYNKEALTNKEVTVSGDGFAKDEGATYKVTGSQTEVGESDNTFTYELKSNTKASNYNITKEEGKLSITPVTDEVTVTIKGNKDTAPYNGTEQSVGGYTVESISNTLYTSTDFTLNGQATATGKDAATYPMNLDATQFVNNNTNFSNVKFEIAEDGQLVISPRAVTLTSQTDSKDYDGTPLTRPNVKVEGNFVDGEVTEVKATGSVTYVSEGAVVNTIVITKGENFKESNYSITKNEGKLSITEVDAEVIVTIKGHEDSVTYDGKPHSVEGYEITDISNKLYTKDDVQFTGQAKAEGTEAGTYYMGLAEAQFSNTNSNFKKVTFVVEDGSLTINRKSIDDQNRITVTKPEDSKYNGEEHKNKPTVTDTKTGKTLVEGTDYTLAYSDDVTNAGTVTVTIKGIGNYSGTTTTNYQILKRDVTLTSGSASRVYNKEALTNGEVTVSGDGFAKNEGATYKVTGSQTEVGESKNTFTYELKSNTTASNYNITKAEGKLIVTAEDGEVVVTITGHSDSVEYDGNEKTVSGYGVTITEGSTYTTDDFTFSGTAEAKGIEAGTYLMGLNADQFTNTNGNYEKVRFVVNDGSLTISPKSITPDGPDTPEEKKTGITVTDPEDSTYDGNEHINGLTVTDSKLNTTLVEDTDYTLTYSGDLINVGTVTITIKGIGNYTGEFTKTYQILPREYTVTTNTDSKVYDGTALTAGGTVNNLVKGETVGFTITGSQTNVGTSDNTYELNWTGTAKEKNYKHGKDSIGTLTITKKSIVPDGPNTPDEEKTGITVTDPEGSKYDGEEHRNKPTVEDTKTKATLVEGTDYELSYSEDVVNAGTVTVTVTGIGNYEGSFEVTYEITKRHVTLTSVDDEKVYDGSALTNDTVTVGGDKFAKKEGATYNVTGSQTEVGSSQNTFTYELKTNTKASNYDIEVKFGELKVTPFTDKVTVTIKGHEDTATYDGNPHSVEGYEVTNISNELYKKDYVGFTGEAKAEGTAAGTYQMNLTAQQFSNISQNFTDVEFVVEDGSLTISPKSITPDGPDTPDEKKTGITVTDPEGSKYDGEEHKNKPTVTDTKTDKVLVEGTDYTLAYSDDVINAGTVTVTVKGIGNYEGSFEVTYEITKRNVTLTSGSASKVYDKTALTKDEVTVSGDGFAKDEGATYKVTGSRTKVGTSKNTFTYELKSNTTATNYNIEVKFGELKVTAQDGEVVVTITGHSDSVEYDGNEKSVSGYDVSITEGSKYTTSDFTFNGTAEAKGTEAGTYSMGLNADQFTNTNDNYTQVTFIVNDGTLTINPKSINPDDEKNGITVTDPENSIYDGNEHINGLTVTDSKLNTTLVEGTDYTLTYSGDLINVGTVTITIKGIGNYTGEFTKTYQILPREYTVTTNTDSKVYDGTALTTGGTVNNLVKDETVNLTMTGSQTNVGTSDNTYELNWTGTAKEKNYTHGKDSIGTLTVKAKSIVPDGPDTPDEKKTGITVTDPKDSKYDGEEHRNKPTVTDTKTKATLKEGTDYELSYSEDVVNAGTVTVTVTGIGNYEGSFEVTYEITKRHVTLTSVDDEKVYDGSALTNDTVTVGGDKFAKKEGATYNVTGMQIEKGSSKNTFTYTLNEGTLAGNYDIETFEGTLKVTAFENEVVVTIKGNKDTVTYDGNPHSVEGYVITDISNKLYKAEYIGVKGYARAEGTAAGTYKMNLTAQQFSNTSASFDKVTFKVEDGSLTISPKSITPDGPDTPDEKKTGITVTAPEDSKYDGEEHRNKPTVTDTKTKATLKEGTDYELSYSKDVINAGTVTVIVKGIGNYEGSFEVTYEITKRNVTLTSGSASKVYDKTALTKDEVTVSGDGFAKDEGATYKVTGSRTKVGTSKNTFTYELKSNTTATNYNIEVKFGELKVTAQDGEVVVTITGHSDSVEYDGNEKSVSGYDVSITEGSKYTTSDFTFNGTAEAKGTEAGTYSMGLNADQFTNTNDNYTQVTFIVNDGTLTINPKSINPDDEKNGITVTDPENSIYDGNEHINGLTVTDSKLNTTLVEGTDYTLTYSGDLINVGTVTITIKGIGNYTGEFTKTYQILPREYTVTTNTDSKVYDGTALTAGGTVNNLVKGETVGFTITGSQTNVGTSDNTYELNWTGTAKEKNYKHGKDSIGKLTVTKQSIVPDPEHPETYKEVTITSPSDEVYDGKEHKWIPTVTDKEGNELVAKTDYEVTYSTTDFTNVTGTITVTITGIGNYTGKATRTYSITPKTYTVTTESDSKVYDGTALTAGGKVSGIVKGETVDLTITGSQTSVGTSDNTYELNWTGSAKESNYKHGKDSIGTLTVKAKSIVPDGPDTPKEEKTGITVSDPSDSKYDGKEHREVLTVSDTKTNEELVAEKDYSVTYSDDLVNAGTVTITIEGIGNYTGSFTKTYEITKRSVTLTSATASKTYDGQALTSTSITVSGDGFVKGEGATYNVTGTQTEVGNSANSFEYKLNENTLASNYDITKVVGTLTITAAPAPVIPAPTPRTPSVPQVITPVETVEKEETPKAEEPKTEKVEEEYTPKASPQYYWALINLICAIVTVLFGLLLLISKRHKDEDDEEEDDETKQQTTTNEDEEKEQEKKRGTFTRVLAVLIAIVSVVFFLVTEDLSLPWTWTDQWTIWMVALGLVQIVVFFVGRKWKNVDNDDDDEEAQQA